MSPEPAEPDKEVEAILSDLDTILSGMSPASTAAPAPAAAPPPAPASPPPAPEPKPAPAPAAAAQPGIELPPRSGLPPAPKPAEKPKPASTAAPAPAAHPPLEIQLPGGSAAPRPAAPAPAPAPVAQAPAPAPAAPPPPPPAAAKPVPVPESAPKPAPAPAAAPAPDGAAGIPADAAKEQIRRVAFLCAETQRGKLDELMGFLDTVALKVSKKPMYIRRVLVQPVQGKEDPKKLLESVKAAGASGTVAMLAGLPDSWVRELEETAGDVDHFFRVIPPEEAQKRSTAVDLLVDLMLLAP